MAGGNDALDPYWLPMYVPKNNLEAGRSRILPDQVIFGAAIGIIIGFLFFEFLISL
jgi:hypothetical protein